MAFPRQGDFKRRLLRSFPIFRDMILNRSGAFVRVKKVTGAAAGNLTIGSGVLHLGDELLCVLSVNTAAASDGVADLTSEFKITADDTINNTGGTSTASNSVIVFWIPWIK